MLFRHFKSNIICNVNPMECSTLFEIKVTISINRKHKFQNRCQIGYSHNGPVQKDLSHWVIIPSLQIKIIALNFSHSSHIVLAGGFKSKLALERDHFLVMPRKYPERKPSGIRTTYTTQTRRCESKFTIFRGNGPRGDKVITCFSQKKCTYSSQHVIFKCIQKGTYKHTECALQLGLFTGRWKTPLKSGWWK